MRLTIAAAAALASLAVATPACAQRYIYIPIVTMGPHNSQTERSCMRGRKPKTSLFFAARANATIALQRYLHLAASGAPADGTGAFTRDADKREWLRNGTAGAPGAVDDPLARMVAARDFALPAPASFYLAGDDRTALGIWRIPGTNSPGPAGHYRIFFRRDGQDWVLQRLEIVEGDAAPAPIAPYCHISGDLPTRAASRKR